MRYTSRVSRTPLADFFSILLDLDSRVPLLCSPAAGVAELGDARDLVNLPHLHRNSHKGDTGEIGGHHAASIRREYTDAFKTEAVRLVSDSRRPVAQIARELSIPENVLYRWMSYRWVSGQRRAHAQGTTPATLRAEREELAKLNRENLLLRQERDFLKRAAACFARESL